MKRSRIWLIFLFGVIAFNAIGQCRDWNDLIWYENLYIDDAAGDRFGNRYIAGHILRDFTIGEYTFHKPTRGFGAFIAKFDKNDELIWAINPFSAILSEIEVDEADNILVAGYYNSSIDSECVDLQVTGQNNIFVASYNRDGIFRWATSSSGPGTHVPLGLTISKNGNIILCGSVVTNVTSGMISIGGTPILTRSMESYGYDSFVACILPTGVVSWTKAIAGSGNHSDVVSNVATDSHNNVIIIGGFDSDSISIDKKIVYRGPPSMAGNFFLVKIDETGKVIWARSGVGGSDQHGGGVGVDPADNIFITGSFEGDARLDEIELATNGSYDVFIAKLDPEGTVQAARSMGGHEVDLVTDLLVDRAGRILITGYYGSDYLEVGPYSTTNPYPNADSYVATFSNDLASVECARFITGRSNSFSADIELDASDNILFRARVDFPENGTTFGSETVSFSGSVTILAVLGNNGAPDENELPGNPISLGPDRTFCAGKKLTLASPLCGAEYLWSTGSTASSIQVTDEGLYWVEVTVNGQTVRDEVQISFEPAMDVTLGGNKELCPGEVVTWILPHYEKATYVWKNGSDEETNTAHASGVVWVNVKNQCELTGDTVTVLVKMPPDVKLGDDQVSCDGMDVVLEYHPEDYETIEWSTGSTASSIAVASPGDYRISVFNGCITVMDEVSVTLGSSPVVELGETRELCDESEVILSYEPKEGEAVQWTDGSRGSAMMVKTPGLYGVGVTNACGTVRDVVEVAVTPYAGEIPNVITPNGDGKNEIFVLPDEAHASELLIYNRWGRKVFYAQAYENNWPQKDIGAGVYYYELAGSCISHRQGTIHVLGE